MTIDRTLGDWHEIPFGDSHGFVSVRYVLSLGDDDAECGIPAATETIDQCGIASDHIQPTLIEPKKPPLSPARLLPEAGSTEERSVSHTWNRYGGLLERLSGQKQLDTACAVAVICVESSGDGFSAANGGRMVIRFENHKFWRYWGKHHPGVFRRHFRYRSDQVWLGHQWRRSEQHDWQTFHGNQGAEWDVLDFARTLDNDAALLSISMGAPQIMGFHYERLGYQSVQEMFDDFCSSIEAQMQGLVEFLTPGMIERLQRQDFVGFAALYNGSGQKDKYGSWIERHYQAFKGLYAGV